MKLKLAAQGGEKVGWVIQNDEMTITIRCADFEIYVPSKTVVENFKAYLEFETENDIIVRKEKVIIY